MRVLIDTNVLFSALLFRNSTPARALFHVADHQEMVLCDYCIKELLDKIEEKRPDLLAHAERLLAVLPFELVHAPRASNSVIADPKDAPILNAAVLAEVDLIISGDKHFLQAQMEHPRVLTAAAYLELAAEIDEGTV